MRGGALVALLLVLPGFALGETVERSPRPLARPLAEQAVETVATFLRPRSRPVLVVSTANAPAEPPLRPLARPDDLRTERVAAAVPEPMVEEPPPARSKKRVTRRGSVCGVAEIKGEALARVGSKTKGCGIAEPVRVTSVSGVRLDPPATIDCATAQALNAWVTDGLQPAIGRVQVVELQVAAHYACRSRNNKKGAPISEHGKGKAIDISAIVLENGTVLSVLRDWGRVLRRAHQAACGPFTTTLGPGSDGYHEDHMHFDTASRRGRGRYCR